MSDNVPLKVNLLGDASDAKKAFSEVSSAARQTAKGIATAVAASAAAFALVESQVISVSAEFENFQVRLQHTLGSVEEGNRLFKDMTTFASKVPFAFNDIMDAATNLSGVMTGGVDDVNKWMPMIADLAAVSGLSIQQTTEQVVRMYSAGAGAADLFRERGITAMLGFQSGVSVSAEDTRKQLIAAFEDPASKFAGAANDLAKTWDGSVSMMGDKWTLFVKDVGDKGAFNAAKGVLSVFLDEIDNSKSGIGDLSTAISDGLVSSMQVGIFATAELAKGMVALTAVDDVLRLGVDKTSGVIVDAFSAELEGISGLLMMIRDVTGQDLGVASIEATISSMDELRRGIAASEQESVGMLDSAVASANDSINQIDALSNRLFLAAENGRNTNNKDNQDGSKPSGGGGKDPSAEGEAKALAAAQKVIDIHSAKFKRMQVMGETFGLSESDRLLALNDFELNILDQERIRMESAALSQGANKESLDALDAYYDELKITRAQETSDALGEIETLAQEGRLQRLVDGEQAAYDLKAQFQQLLTDNQQVNLDAMSENLAKFAKTSAAWDKFTGQQKLGFAAATMGALSGLMKSEGRKQFEVGKAAAQGENAINTYLGATKAFQAMSGIPYVGPILGAVAAAAVIAAGMANAQKISSAKMGGSTGGVSVPTLSAGGGGASPVVPINQPTGIPESQQQNQTHVTVFVSGVVSQDQLVNEIVPYALKSKIATEDFVLVDQNSTNAQVLQAA